MLTPEENVRAFCQEEDRMGMVRTLEDWNLALEGMAEIGLDVAPLSAQLEALCRIAMEGE